MRCPNPKCNAEFEHKVDIFAGKHATYDCKCGQLIDWDYLGIEPTGRPGQLRCIGVAPCQHADKKRPSAREPLT